MLAANQRLPVTRTCPSTPSTTTICTTPPVMSCSGMLALTTGRSLAVVIGDDLMRESRWRKLIDDRLPKIRLHLRAEFRRVQQGHAFDLDAVNAFRILHMLPPLRDEATKMTPFRFAPTNFLSLEKAGRAQQTESAPHSDSAHRRLRRDALEILSGGKAGERKQAGEEKKSIHIAEGKRFRFPNAMFKPQCPVGMMPLES